MMITSAVPHAESLWGAVANIFIMAEMRYAHINR